MLKCQIILPLYERSVADVKLLSLTAAITLRTVMVTFRGRLENHDRTSLST